MNGKEFRRHADFAVIAVANYMDEFPECDCTMLLTGKFGTITVGIGSEFAQAPEEDGNEHED